MKKVILLSTVLGLGALGMACSDGANNANTNKPVNIAPAASPVSSPVVVASPVNMPANNSAMKSNTMANNSSAIKPGTMANNANKPK